MNSSCAVAGCSARHHRTTSHRIKLHRVSAATRRTGALYRPSRARIRGKPNRGGGAMAARASCHV